MLTHEQRRALKLEYEKHLAKVIDDLTGTLNAMREAPTMKENSYGVPAWRDSIMRLRLYSEEAVRDVRGGCEAGPR